MSAVTADTGTLSRKKSASAIPPMATNTGAPTSAASTITATSGSESHRTPGPAVGGAPRHARGKQRECQRHHALAHPHRQPDREQLPLLAIGLHHAVGR